MTMNLPSSAKTQEKEAHCGAPRMTLDPGEGRGRRRLARCRGSSRAVNGSFGDSLWQTGEVIY